MNQLTYLALLVSVIGITTACMAEEDNMFENCEKDVCGCLKKIVEIVC
jgi:hypothetical protein